jgi:integrase/recombinase XerD
MVPGFQRSDIMKRPAHPALSTAAQTTLAAYAHHLSEVEDLAPPTIRGYLSDLRHFAAWCEATWTEGQDAQPCFAPAALSTPLLTRYRAYLQTTARLKPASINRALMSIKRYCMWALEQNHLQRDPAKVVKLVGEEAHAPRHLSDHEEEALLTAVTAHGSVRDRTIITLLLHTGLRASELCELRCEDVQLGRRSGTLRVRGKRNKYREVPLNATARAALQDYLPMRSGAAEVLFPSGKTQAALTVRALGHLIQKYAAWAHIAHVSPHDLRHRFGYRMAAVVPLHRLAQIMGHDSLDTTMGYIQGTKQDLQQEVEKIAWA